MENLKKMKECLVGVAESQVYGNMDKVNAQELGEVMDMIKDLSEAVYYCTITESMEKQAKEERGESRYMYDPRMDEHYRPGTMYARGGSGMGGNSSNGGSRNYSDGMIRRYDDGQTSYSMYDDGRASARYHEPMPYGYREAMMRDPREGRSGERRKMYMEGKMYKDKTKQMQELESYMQELASDMTEMIQDASPEEKQLLQSKLTTLAAKMK